jgi:arylformamidase
MWLDVSVPIKDNMVTWPGDPAVRVERTARMEDGDSANISSLAMGSHTGTHVDAPYHFLKGGSTLDRMPPDALIGPARVIEIRHRWEVTADELKEHRIRRGQRILFKTRNSGRCWKSAGFVKDFVFISPGAARYLAQRRVRAVGIDYLSVGPYEEDGGQTGVEVHRILLASGIWIIEGLDLRKAGAGRYQLICLPLRVFQSDGAPARAVLSPLS